MDLDRAIRELTEEKKRLDKAIAALERRTGEGPAARKRAWSGAARKAAAERMRQYWAARRGELDAGTSTDA
ncbi:MAG: hypothetical protein IPM24_01360 [Bryobacterales bacterium]|jgi:hypothetical protein|nr:hypothetical protein [Bryobacterales bacterium]